MNKYEELLNEAVDAGVSVDEDFPFIGNTSGLYIDGNIALSAKLDTSIEKACVLAEELGHHYTSVGNILDMTSAVNRKQERQARLHGYNRLIGLTGIINAFNAGCQNKYEIAEYLEISDEYLQECIDCYRDKYGIYTIVDNYIIYFIPYLAVAEII